MIKFFRHIRRSLLNDNKMGKYFKYAFGEIILVMIGILLALQVNNWNNNRIEANEEREVIDRLHADFKENKKALKQFLYDINVTNGSQQKLMNLIGASKEELNKIKTSEYNAEDLVNLEVAAFVAIKVFVPLYRRVNSPSAYT